jgi:8-oxo-dGTP pyrophosphatase MutT (NUDIX family)
MPPHGDGARLPGREGPAVPAAVLVPLVARDDELTILLTQRSEQLPDHPGQISFPGGRWESHDHSAAEAALRESSEEIGLNPARVTILGELAPYETVTGYRVTPVVGWIAAPFQPRIDPVEVADAFEIPLEHFLDPANYRRCSRVVGGRAREYYEVPYADRYVWGATAAMLLIFYRTLFEDV